VNISWKWYNEQEGLVEWTFQNQSSNQVSVILLRNGYYFGNAFWCTKPDEILLGDNKAINQINIGDQIIGRNSLTRVKHVDCREYNGNLIRIKANGMIPFDVTPEHPILTTRNIHNNGGVKIIGFRQPEFKEAWKINPKITNEIGDYLVVPRLQGFDETKVLNLEKFSKRINSTPIRSIVLDENVAWLMGLYTAEGYTGGVDDNSAYLALNINEKDTLALKAKNIIESLGFTSRIDIREERNGCLVVISSRVLSKALKEWCGYGAHNKKIPDFILYHKNPKILEMYLDGLISGDGWTTKSGHGFSTTSKLLALQFQLAYIRLGKFPTCYVWGGGEESFDGKIIHCSKQYRFRVLDNLPVRSKLQSDCIYVPIRKVEKIPYSGDVWNVQTEDNNLLISNAITHNCVYVANPQFDVSWATSLTPLVDKGINNNSPPIGLVQFGSNQIIVAFLFTLAPHQEWSVLEGGFSASFPPIAPAVYQVSLISTGEYCIGYDQAQVSQWDQQTGTSYQGYEPNPSTFNTVLVQAPSNAIYTQLYPADTAIAGQCSGSPTNQCITEIEQGIQNANIIQIIDGILCLLSKYGIDIEDIIKRKIMKHI